MTREVMLDSLDIACKSYDTCTCDTKGRCPLYDRDNPCVAVTPESHTDEEVKRSYEKMFGVKFLNNNPNDPNTTNNPVSHPSHYTQGNIQCIDAMQAAFGKEAVATWCKINAFKYIWREEHKNGMEDIDKAVWYLNKFKELKASGE